jgi:hypothetical protein
MWVKNFVRRNKHLRLHSRQRERAGRPWAVTANALLLLLQAAGFLGLSALYLGPLGDDWPLTPEGFGAERIAALTGASFAILAVMALVAALGFVRMTPSAWLMAVMAQGGNLLLALVLYYGGRPAYVYGMMVYGIIMVLYLHQADVQTAFRGKLEPLDQDRHL